MDRNSPATRPLSRGPPPSSAIVVPSTQRSTYDALPLSPKRGAGWHSELAVIITFTIQMDDGSGPPTLRTMRSPSSATTINSARLSARGTWMARGRSNSSKSTAQKGSNLDTSPSSISDLPSSTPHVIRGLKANFANARLSPAAYNDFAKKATEQIDKYLMACHIALTTDNDNTFVVGLITKHKKASSAFAIPQKINVGLPSAEWRTAMTNHRWIYAVCYGRKKFHVCAIDIASIYKSIIILITANLKRIKQEAKISQNWPMCSINVRVNEVAAMKAIQWLCCRGTNNSNVCANKMPLPRVLSSIDPGSPQPGLIRQDLTFSIGALKSYIASQINVKGSYVTIEKFLIGYLKRLRKRNIDEIMVYDQLRVQHWRNSGQVPTFILSSAPDLPGNTTDELQIHKTGPTYHAQTVIIQFNFDEYRVTLTPHTLSDEGTDSPVQSVKLDTIHA